MMMDDKLKELLTEIEDKRIIIQLYSQYVRPSAL